VPQNPWEAFKHQCNLTASLAHLLRKSTHLQTEKKIVGYFKNEIPA